MSTHINTHSHELSQTIEPEQLTPPTTPDLSPRHTLRQTIRFNQFFFSFSNYIIVSVMIFYLQATV